jgi:hypothetical protein
VAPYDGNSEGRRLLIVVTVLLQVLSLQVTLQKAFREKNSPAPLW